MIVAVNPNGVIGKAGKIPWKYPGDLRRFKRITVGSTVIMGRKTWESLGRHALTNRRNIVISSRPAWQLGVGDMDNVFQSLLGALDQVRGDAWIIGGAQLYEEGQMYADVIDMTFVPDVIEHAKDVVYLPPLHLNAWFSEGPLLAHEDEPTLTRRVYTAVRKSSVVP